MRGANTWRVPLAAIAAFLLAVAATALDQTPGDIDGGSDDDALRELWSTLDAAWNERDAERFSDLFTADGTLMFVDRDVSLEGRATIRHHFAERFPRFPADLRHRTTMHRTRAVTSDVRAVDGGVEILRLGSGDNVEPTTFRTFAVFAVVLRTPAGWKILALRAYRLPEAVEDRETLGQSEP